MKKLITTKLILSMCLVLITNLTYSQKKIKLKDVRKTCDAGLYEQGINLGNRFLYQSPNHFEVHYILAKAYSYRASEFVQQQNKNIQLQKIENWGEEDYINNIDLWKKVIRYQDSSMVLYKKSMALVNDGFLTKNAAICGSGFGTCYSEFSENYTIESAKQYIKENIININDALTSNKAKYKEVEDKYALFKAHNTTLCYQYQSKEETYTAKITFKGNTATGQIYVEYIEVDDYDVSFTGTIKDNNLIVKASYSNDAMGPYEETWKTISDRSTITINGIVLNLTSCNE